MNTEQFEITKRSYLVDDFMQNGLQFDNLTMKDYMEFMPKILPLLLTHTEKDPVEIFENLMSELETRWIASAKLPFHGPWHHGIIPAVLILALKNNLNPNISDIDVKEAFSRGIKIPAGSCGFSGACGGGLGVGIAVSIALKATPFHNEERTQVLAATVETLTKIQKLHGPRCCRLSSFVALEKGPEKLSEMGLTIPVRSLTGYCEHYEENSECHTVRCPYYAKNKNKN